MSDAAGQHADGFHFLRLPELLLKLFVLGDVDDYRKRGVPAGIGDGMNRDFGIDDIAFLDLWRNCPRLCPSDTDLSTKSLNPSFSLAARMSFQAHRQELLARIAVTIHGDIVDIQKLEGIAVENPHGLRVVLEKEPEFGFALRGQPVHASYLPENQRRYIRQPPCRRRQRPLPYVERCVRRDLQKLPDDLGIELGSEFLSISSRAWS